MSGPTVDERRPKQSLADDPAFLASLEGLDAGIDDRTGARASAAKSPRPPGAAAPSLSRPASAAPRDQALPAAGQPAPASPRPPRRRSVLELFPPPAPASVDEHRASDPERATAAPSRARGAVAAPGPIVIPSSAASGGPVGAARYLAFYGLDEDPFASTADPRFFYHARSHDAAAQNLLTAIRRREGVVVVTGPDGVGKTTLCRTVIEHLDRRTLTSFVADPPRTFEELAATALVDFGVMSRAECQRRTPRPDELLTAMREFLSSLGPLDAFAVLFLDNAQRVPSSMLRELGRLADSGGDERLLQIVLVGREPLDRKLRGRDLKQLAAAVTVRCRVAPLEATEIPSYVMHRLTTAGANPRVDFADGAFARIHALSAGVPAIVNQLGDRVLDVGASAGADVIDRELVDQAAAEMAIEPPASRVVVVLRAAVALLVLIVLLLTGAAGAAYVFRDRLSGAMTTWEQIPPSPARPALPRTSPIAPVVAPAP